MVTIRAIVLRTLAPIASPLHRFSSKLFKRTYPDRESRRWSNSELRRWAPFLKGSVINVSGWEDRDKGGSRYEEYFTARSSYNVSNIGGARGSTGATNEIFIDLEAPLPDGLRGRFDVVFNHTVLEHIYDIHTAVRNLCLLSRDVVVVVVPFAQEVHFDDGSYLDYWRPTPFALATMFEENGFTMIYCSQNASPVHNIYTFCVAASDPERWKAVFPASLADMVHEWRARKK